MARRQRGHRPAVAELSQHRQAAAGDIGGRRIEQRAVIGEGDVVQIIVVLSASKAPQPPLRTACRGPSRWRASNARAGARRVARSSAIADHRGVVDVGIMRVGVLKGPAARPIPGRATPSRRPRRSPAARPASRAPPTAASAAGSPASISAEPPARYPRSRRDPAPGRGDRRARRSSSRRSGSCAAPSATSAATAASTCPTTCSRSWSGCGSRCTRGNARRARS